MPLSPLPSPSHRPGEGDLAEAMVLVGCLTRIGIGAERHPMSTTASTKSPSPGRWEGDGRGDRGEGSGGRSIIPPMQPSSWRRRLGLERGVGALAAGLFVYGFGEELWFRYVPAYLRWLGASPFLVGAFGTFKDFLDAGYAYPGGVITDRLGSRRALLLFGALTVAGFALYWAAPSIPMIFIGLPLVMAWQSLGLPATFSLLKEELSGGGRLVGFTVQSVVKRLPIVLAPPLGGYLIQRYGMAGGMRTGFFF